MEPKKQPTLEIDAHIAINLNREIQNPAAVVVYLYLLSFEGSIKGPVFLSHQKLADHTGISKSTIQRIVRDLETLGLVAVTRLKATSEPGYEIRRPWDKKATVVKKTIVKKNIEKPPRKVKKLNKYEEAILHKESVFKQKLSDKQQKNWLDDYRKRLGEPGSSIDEKTIQNMAIDQWYRLLPK